MPPKRKAGEIVDANDLKRDGVLHFLHFKEKSSDKFYELSISGTRVTSRYGRNGTQGATVFKDFANVDEALEFVAVTLAEKVRKGYVEEESAETAVEHQKNAPTPTATASNDSNLIHDDDLPDKDSSKATTGESNSAYLECTEGGSSKFYEIIRNNDKVSIRYGRIGTDGVKSDKEFKGDTLAAAKFFEKTVAEKAKKGYVAAQRTIAGQAKTYIACNQEFRADRATIHLFSQKEDNNKGDDGDDDDGDDEEDGGGDDKGDGESPEIYNMNKKILAKLRPYLRRGDLLENVTESGYRSSGLYMYDGKNVTHLGDDLDDYGCIHKDYVIYKEFNPHYWHFSTMNVHNLLVPDRNYTNAGWHSGDYPCAYVYAPAIKAAVNLKVHFQGEDYPITGDFKAWVETDPDTEESGEFAYVGEPDDYVLVGLVYDN